MKKSILLLLIVLLLFSISSCKDKNEGNVGDAMSYTASNLRVVIPEETNSTGISKDLKKGNRCKDGLVLGWDDSNATVGDAFGAIFGGEGYDVYLWIKQCEIHNCIVWESAYVTESTPIELSSITTQSSTSSTKTSIGIAAKGEYKGITGSASFNYEKSSLSTVSHSASTSYDLSINLTGLDTKNFKYAQTAIANIEVIKVYKCIQTVEWLQTKYKFSYHTTFVRFTDDPDFQFQLIYKENDLKI